MFVIRRKNAATIEAQEPSSPKVTCIGQVRVRRSKNFTPSRPGRLKQSQGTCPSFSVTKCSICTPRKTNLLRWASLFRFRCCKKVDVRDNSSKLESNERSHVNNGETEVTAKEAQIEEKEDNEEVLKGTETPPKNALLLTRCRSAPFRSSSLAVQFWGETNNETGDEVKMTSNCCDSDQRESESRKQMSRKSRIDGEGSDQMCAIGKLQNQNQHSSSSSSSIGKKMEQVDNIPHPLLLTRCKSESASKSIK